MVRFYDKHWPSEETLRKQIYEPYVPMNVGIIKICNFCTQKYFRLKNIIKKQKVNRIQFLNRLFKSVILVACKNLSNSLPVYIDCDIYKTQS